MAKQRGHQLNTGKKKNWVCFFFESLTDVLSLPESGTQQKETEDTLNILASAYPD